MDGSAEGRFSIRAICKEGSTSLQTLSAMAFVLRVSLVDANSPPRLTPRAVLAALCVASVLTARFRFPSTRNARGRCSPPTK
jgi:hypothetical protein